MFSYYRITEWWSLNRTSGSLGPTSSLPGQSGADFPGSCSEGTYCISGCACCLLSCYWLPLIKAWLPLCKLPPAIYIHAEDITWSFSSPGWTVTIISAFPHKRDVLVPSPSLCPFFGLFSASLLQFVLGNSILDTGVASPMLSKAFLVARAPI